MAHVESDKKALAGINILRKIESNKKILSELSNDVMLAMQAREARPNHFHIDYNGAKYSFDKLSLWNIPARLKYYRVKEGVTVIINKYKGPPYPSLLKGLYFPDSVKVIAANSFKRYTELEFISLGKGLKLIENSAFEGCKKLKNVVLPDGLLSIRGRAFCDDESLEFIYLPDSIQFIAEDALAGCNKVSICVSKEHCNRITRMLSGSFRKVYSDYSLWEADGTAQEKRNYENKLNSKNCYNEDNSDEDNFYAMTDGMYGDYPDDGFDGDYEFMGY